MAKPRRKHRRKYAKGASCGCPEGSKRVSTCRTAANGQQVCGSRGFACLGSRRNKRGKLVTSFVKMVCSGDTTPKLPSKSRSRRQSSKQLLLPTGEKTPTQLILGL